MDLFNPQFIYYYYRSIEEIVPKDLVTNLQQKRQYLRQFKYSILSAILGHPISADDLSYNSAGKPILTGNEFSFSVSHSREYYFLAWVHKRVQLGADIEANNRYVPRKVMQHVLSPVEWENLASNPQIATEFIRFWTQKEAFIKAKGIGIFSGLKKMEFNKNPNQSQEVYALYDQQRYQFMLLNFKNQIGTICTDDLSLQLINQPILEIF